MPSILQCLTSFAFTLVVAFVWAYIARLIERKYGPTGLVVLGIGAIVGLLFMASTSLVRGAEPDPYSTARAESIATGKPLLILVGADWCKPCHDVRRIFGAQLQAAGVYVHLDIDRDVDPCRKLPRVDMLPTLIIYERDALGGWKKPRLIIGLEAIGSWLRTQVVKPLLGGVK